MGCGSKRVFGEALHISIALNLVLAYFHLLDIFKPSYEILVNGVMWDRVYRIGFLDHGLHGLIPLTVAMLTLALFSYKAEGFKKVKPARVVYYVLATLSAVNLLPLLHWTLHMLDPSLTLNYVFMDHRRISELDSSLLHIYAPLYPLLLLATLYSWLPPILRRIFMAGLKVRFNITPSKMSGYSKPDTTSVSRFGLPLLILLSIGLPVIPYLPTINPDFRPASTDIRYYSTWLGEMLSRDGLNALKYAFQGVENGNRPLYLLILYGLVSIGVPREIALNLEAVYIAPLFILAVYHAAKHLSGNGYYAILASLAGVLGFNMTIGMAAGFFAAWTALIPFYTCITLTPTLAESRRSLAMSIVASIALLYIHPWTWSLLMAILLTHLALSTVKGLREGKIEADRSLLMVLALNALAELVKAITSPIHSGVAASTTLIAEGGFFGIQNLLRLPWNLHRLSTSYMGGLFLNPLHMFLALTGMLSLLKRRDEISRPILTWVAVSSSAFLISSISVQSHLLFAMPFPILIAEGLWSLSNILAKLDPKLPRLFQVFFIVSSLTYTVRALCNLM